MFHSTADTKRDRFSSIVKDLIAFQLISISIDPKGRFVLLEAQINLKPYTLLALYVPSTRQIYFLKNTINKAKETRVGDVIICGDLNIVMDRKLDRLS